MGTLQRVSTVASILVRHACAYVDLVADDVALAIDALHRRLMVAVVLVAAALFTVATACLWAVAAVWDTSARLWLIGGLLAAFAMVTVWASVTLRRLSRDARRPLSRTGLEWQKDRQLLEQLLPAVRDGAP